MNYLSVITDKQQRKVWWRAFRIWQHRPHELAPLKEEQHVCASCGTSFEGNYCPRCGQSAKIGRFSFKKALLLFLDVWGLGNRGMFRSIRDLMLRPGYMIRDYIGGMQTAYFPPFKMFFLLAALALVIEHGFGLTEDEETVKEEAQKEEIAKKDLAKEELAKEGIKMEWSNASIEVSLYTERLPGRCPDSFRHTRQPGVHTWTRCRDASSGLESATYRPHTPFLLLYHQQHRRGDHCQASFECRVADLPHPTLCREWDATEI